jgi:predicted nucleic acid-binding protein
LSAQPAAAAFRVYLERRKASGNPTEACLPLPDFFIGAHAAAAKLALVTRDPDRVKTYFPGVALEPL